MKKFSENKEIHVKMKKITKLIKMRKVAPWAPKAENVALAWGILSVLGAQSAEMEKMTKFSEI